MDSFSQAHGGHSFPIIRRHCSRFRARVVTKAWSLNYLSSPGGTFGGWLCKPDLTLAHKRLLADYLTCRLGNLVWRMNPYEAFIDHPCADMRREDQTDVLDLTTGIDGLFRRWSKGHRRRYTRPSSRGCESGRLWR